jgi:hypothetical protein
MIKMQLGEDVLQPQYTMSGKGRQLTRRRAEASTYMQHTALSECTSSM